MRIISGSKKSIYIKAPNNLPSNVRPTTGKVKESLFNIILNKYDFKNLKVLDLFSGTGNISYEFASRGCLEVISIDNNYNCIRFINKMSSQLELNITTKKIDYKSYLKKNKKKFDIIFADPPYNFLIKQYYEIIELIKTNEILIDEGELIIEHSSKIKLTEKIKSIDERKYGSSVLSFIKKASL